MAKKAFPIAVASLVAIGLTPPARAAEVDETITIVALGFVPEDVPEDFAAAGVHPGDLVRLRFSYETRTYRSEECAAHQETPICMEFDYYQPPSGAVIQIGSALTLFSDFLDPRLILTVRKAPGQEAELDVQGALRSLAPQRGGDFALTLQGGAAAPYLNTSSPPGLLAISAVADAFADRLLVVNIGGSAMLVPLASLKLARIENLNGYPTPLAVPSPELVDQVAATCALGYPCPFGERGAQGPAGPVGPTGPTGPRGESVVGMSVGTGDPNCPYGGSRFTVGGVDSYACNGAPGYAALPIGTLMEIRAGSPVTAEFLSLFKLVGTAKSKIVNATNDTIRVDVYERR